MESQSVKERKINQKKQQQKKSFRFSGSFFQTFPVHFSWPCSAKLLLATAPVALLFLLQCEHVIEILLLLLNRDCTCSHPCCLIAKCSQNINGQVMCVGEPIL